MDFKMDCNKWRLALMTNCISSRRPSIVCLRLSFQTRKGPSITSIITLAILTMSIPRRKLVEAEWFSPQKWVSLNFQATLEMILRSGLAKFPNSLNTREQRRHKSCNGIIPSWRWSQPMYDYSFVILVEKDMNMYWCKIQIY